MNARMMKIAVFGIAVLLLAQTVPAGASEVTLSSDDYAKVSYKPSDGANNVLYQNNLPVGSEANTYLVAGLINFDIAALVADGYNPATDKIDSLTFNLNIFAVSNPSDPNNYARVHAVSQDDGNWGSDSSQGYDAAFVTYDTTVLGTSTAPAAAGTTQVISLSGTDLTTLVNSWISGKNAGFAMVGDGQLHSSTTRIVVSGSTSTLSVAYSPVPEPATMAMLGLGGVMMLVRRRRKIAG